MTRVYIEASAPTRIDLAGGTLDIWPLYLFHDGAQTLNAAISLRAHARSHRARTGRARHRVGRHRRPRRGGPLVRAARHARAAAARPAAPLLSGRRASSCTRASRLAGRARASPDRRRSTSPCAARSRVERRARCPPTQLLQIAMNVEAQAIDVPTGVQDYRPAFYGGISAVELGVGRRAARGAAVEPDGAAAAPRAGLHRTRRATRASTTGTSRSGTSTATATCSRRFARIRDIAAAMRDGARAARLARGRPADRRRVGQPQAPRAGRHHAGDRRDACRGARRRRARRQGLRRRRRRLSLLLRRARTMFPAIRTALAAAGARVLDFTIEPRRPARSKPATPRLRR